MVEKKSFMVTFFVRVDDVEDAYEADEKAREMIASDNSISPAIAEIDLEDE